MSCQRVRCGQRGDEEILPHGLQAQSRVTDDPADECGVESSVGDLRQPLVGGQAHELDDLPGNAGAQLGEHARQALAQPGARAQAQRGRAFGDKVGDRLLRVLDRRQDRASFGQEARPATVSVTRRLERSSRAMPSSASSRRTCWLTAG